MNSPTLGHKRVKLKPSVISKIKSLRQDGYTCSQIAQMTGTGESTVARYTSDWYQSQKKKGFVAHRGVLRQTNHIVSQPKDYAPNVKFENVYGQKQLSPDVIDYINAIYRSGNFKSGTFIGNLFIRIGKFLGGHNPV